MKKLVYILSLAAGLVLTGCAKWDEPVSEAPDTWGPVPELTVSVNVDETTGALIGDVMEITVITKNAANIGLTVSAETEIDQIDYTQLLQGGYGAFVGEIEAETDTLQLSLPGIEAGSTYYLYVVVANAAGVQETFAQGYGAVDVTAPFITSKYDLTATAGGRRVDLTFSENILCENPQGVSYTILNDNLEVVMTANDATVMAATNKLTVSLPENVLPEGAISYVLLSFEEGTVVDFAGNKMAAINNVMDDMGVPNGPWWVADLTEGGEVVGPEGVFFTSDESFAWLAEFSGDGGKSFQNFGYEYEVSYIGEFDLAAMFEGLSGTGYKWETTGILNAFQNTQPNNLPVITFEYQGNEIVYFMDIDNNEFNGAPNAGIMTLADDKGNPMEATILLGEVEGQNLYTGWQFVADSEGVAYYSGSQAVFFFLMNGQPYLLAEFNNLQMAPMSMVSTDQANVTVLEKPVPFKGNVVNGLQVRNVVR